MDSQKKKVLEWLEEHENEVIEAASEIIAIPTISRLPDANERYDRINSYFAEKFDALNIPHQIYKNGENGGPNFIATYAGSGNGKILAIGGHSDVVPADEPDWITKDPFKAEIIDGKLYGRGAADMKCGLAAAYLAVKALAVNGIKLKGDVKFLSSVDEEVGGMNGMKFLAESENLKCDYLLNAEQTNLKIITSYKGTCYLKVHVTGSAAHGSTPHLGVNAIEKAAKIIQYFKDGGLTWEEDPILGKSTINIGVIQGGSVRNVVADSCTFTMDIRIVRGQTCESVLSEVQNILDRIVRQDPTFKAIAEFDTGIKDPVSVPDDNPLVRAVQANGKEIGVNIECGSFISAGDCSHFLKRGIIALMCGPGSLKDIHKSNEYSYISEIVNSAKVYALTAIDICEAE